MEEIKNYHFEYEEENQVEQIEPEICHGSWVSDEFEESYKRSVPRHRSLTLYKPKPKRAKKFLRSPAFVAVISSLVTCCLCLSIFSMTYHPKSGASSALPQAGDAFLASGYDISQMANSIAGGTFGIPEVYELVSPSVVSITCVTQNGYIQSQMSSGSGIIVRQDGYIVTNNHVIEDATEITVATIAGQKFTAKVVGADERTDLAVLKVSSDQALPFAELGDSSQVRVGEMALAIGNPIREELAGTLTVGYISAINRTMEIDGKRMTMIQTDAAINPGNSGGALLNMKGQVIGINTAKSTGYDVEGLGFAIPINEAKPIISSIIEHGYVTGRLSIGIYGQSVTEAVARVNNLPIGVYISQVMEDSGAQKAGLRGGDVILACDGQKIETIDDINKIRDTHKVGDTMQIEVDRNGQRLTFSVVLQEEKPTKEPAPTQAPQQQQIPQQQIPFPFSWFGW
ncbi:MAG: trypsin-like peptidase domain-containing protein [Clostridia bacterium]|nr:trypsin-like peptidase domain-containing protein [Clostridia bacterium]